MVGGSGGRPRAVSHHRRRSPRSNDSRTRPINWNRSRPLANNETRQPPSSPSLFSSFSSSFVKYTHHCLPHPPTTEVTSKDKYRFLQSKFLPLSETTLDHAPSRKKKSIFKEHIPMEGTLAALSLQLAVFQVMVLARYHGYNDYMVAPKL